MKCFVAVAVAVVVVDVDLFLFLFSAVPVGGRIFSFVVERNANDFYSPPDYRAVMMYYAGHLY